MRKGDLTVLEALARGESVGSARISQKLLERLQDERLIIATSHGSRVSYKAVDPSRVMMTVGIFSDGGTCREDGKPSAGGSSLAGWRSETGSTCRNGGMSGAMSRGEQVAAFGDSKVFRTRSCPGFPVNSYEAVAATLEGQPLCIDPVPGSFLFISDWQKFEIPENVVVVGVENMENFRMVRRQRYLFENLCAPVLFVSRYPQSGDLVAWLRSIPNRYIHFGDLDLAGIHIFMTEFQRHLGSRASFFIPQDVDVRLERGSRDRYDTQLSRFGRLSSSDPSLQWLISLIHKHHRGYDQEGFI